MAAERLVGIDWAARQIVMNLMMHNEAVVHLRKRLFSRENDPSERLTDYGDFQWQIYRDAIVSLKLGLEAANVLELGPGPILANGIRFIAEGAASYTALDRFDLLRRDAEVRRAYR